MVFICYLDGKNEKHCTNGFLKFYLHLKVKVSVILETSHLLCLHSGQHT